jgi:hypothetical protein
MGAAGGAAREARRYCAAMDDVWAPVVAALGASLLTGGLAFGLDGWRGRREARAARDGRRQSAHVRLLCVSGLFAHTADALRLAIEVRSGLREGLDITTGRRKPVDPFELVDVLRRDLEPLYEALSEMWVVGSPEAVHASNAVTYQVQQVVDAATSRNSSDSRLRRMMLGERWSQDERDAYDAELKRLAHARKRLAEIARRECDVEMTDLFASTAEGRQVAGTTA